MIACCQVFGRKVRPGQLIHADKHGFLVIPDEDQRRLLDAATFMDDNECDTLISAARGARTFTSFRILTPGESSFSGSQEEVLEAIRNGRDRFRENAKEKFGKGKGEA